MPLPNFAVFHSFVRSFIPAHNTLRRRPSRAATRKRAHFHTRFNSTPAPAPSPARCRAGRRAAQHIRRHIPRASFMMRFGAHVLSARTRMPFDTARRTPRKNEKIGLTNTGGCAKLLLSRDVESNRCVTDAVFWGCINGCVRRGKRSCAAFPRHYKKITGRPKRASAFGRPLFRTHAPFAQGFIFLPAAFRRAGAAHRLPHRYAVSAAGRFPPPRERAARSPRSHRFRAAFPAPSSFRRSRRRSSARDTPPRFLGSRRRSA